MTNITKGDYVVTITDGVGCQHVFGYEVYGLFTGTVEAGSDLTAVEVYPNPVLAGESFGLVFSVKKAGKIRAAIVAPNGKMVAREQFNVQSGQSAQFMGAPTVNGFYIVHFEMDGQIVGRLKLVVQ